MVTPILAQDSDKFHGYMHTCFGVLSNKFDFTNKPILFLLQCVCVCAAHIDTMSNFITKYKKQIFFIVIGIVCVIFFLVFTTADDSKQSKLDLEDQSALVTPGIISDENTIIETKPKTFSIISPEGDAFEKGQARGWKAKLENYESELDAMADCNWKFYLNENNEEILYQEQTGRVILSIDGKNYCGFTSTFIENRGELRVVVTINFTDKITQLEETYTAEREYIVD